MSHSNKLVPALLLALLAPFVTAASDTSDDKAAWIAAQFPELSPDHVKPSPIDGLYEVTLGDRIAYVTEDAKYMVQGDIFDVASEKNLTEQRRAAARLDAINAIGESSMIIFNPDVPVQHTITVFTDIDCGYCRKLHREIGDYMNEGFRVRYLFFPRSGPNTESWAKADEVWCAKDRNDALTRAKRGEKIESKDCGATPTAQHYRLGQSFGIRGTPAIVTEHGTLVPGYVPAADLKERIEKGDI